MRVGRLEETRVPSRAAGEVATAFEEHMLGLVPAEYILAGIADLRQSDSPVGLVVVVDDDGDDAGSVIAVDSKAVELVADTVHVLEGTQRLGPVTRRSKSLLPLREVH